MEQRLIESAIQWGPGFVLGLLILAGFFRLADRIGMKMVEASQAQARALAAQAQSMEGLTASIKDFVIRDNTEHREMLVLLRFIAQQQQDFQEVKAEHDERKKQTHPHCPAQAS